MARNREQIEREALALSDEDRIALGEMLLFSVSPRDEINESWDAEIVNRIEEINSGEIEGIPLDDAHARLRARLT